MRAPRPRKRKIPEWIERISFILGLFLVISLGLIFFINLPFAITELFEMFINCFI